MAGRDSIGAMSTMDSFADNLNRIARHAAWQVVGMGVLTYFVYHAIYGDRGFIAQSRLQSEIQQAELVLDQVRGERTTLDHRASLLRPGSLDPDMLDERARRLLNYTRPDEVVILQPRGSVALPTTSPETSPVRP
ncbi:septum formation initiator family protein [Arenibaculum sp.]|jgi:cell division protein FtsB|uniref:FtsB family cell division protein n=1 Tax=Arenibaculum sp. TaxID=2865862 RepID=UPI002E0F748F|nr:septum formation initiator family protein [Arenibaculum sp.]